MKVPIGSHCKAVLEAALRHLKDGILNSLEFTLDLLVLWRKIAEGTQHIQRFVVPTFQNQPPRRFWKTWDGYKNEES